jgi:hypothetical protein
MVTYHKIFILKFKHDVAGSILNQVIGFLCLNLLNPSSCTMALGWFSLQKERVSRIFLGSKAQPARKADNLTAMCEPIV